MKIALLASLIFLAMAVQTISFTLSMLLVVVGTVIWIRNIVKEFKKLHTNN